MLKLEKVSKSWTEFEIKNICLEIGDTEYLTILGPSGAGKTLFLELIAGIYTPDSGRIFMDGKDITSLPPEKRNLAYIPQNYALFPHLTVFGNIAYGLKLRKTPNVREEVKEIAKIMGISHLLHRKPKTLSGGESQRVAIARALVVKPKLLLLDEPFSNLDIQTRTKLINEMRKLKSQLSFSALHVTHSFEEVLDLGDTVGIILDGELVQRGEVRDVFSKPVSDKVARFLGFDNIFEGVAEGRILKVDGISIKLPVEAEGRVRIGIRPESILVSKNIIHSENVFKATVTAFEDIGAVIRLTLKAGNIEFRAFVTRSFLFEMGMKSGTEVCIGFNTSDVYVFL
ncbi:molybdenum ABC transporter ATP-binding protein [Archaeoglobales archaeon]|nr:MAG: molybdenum ABC transporter ATP-binding protein [Archaeoglobales archaeon]